MREVEVMEMREWRWRRWKIFLYHFFEFSSHFWCYSFIKLIQIELFKFASFCFWFCSFCWCYKTININQWILSLTLFLIKWISWIPHYLHCTCGVVGLLPSRLLVAICIASSASLEALDWYSCVLGRCCCWFTSRCNTKESARPISPLWIKITICFFPTSWFQWIDYKQMNMLNNLFL